MTNKKKVLELLQNDVLDIELKNCKATDISERITELTDRICDALPKDRTEKHGKWLETMHKDKMRCSGCDIICRIDMYPFGGSHYCPNCGAKMEMESESNG